MTAGWLLVPVGGLAGLAAGLLWVRFARNWHRSNGMKLAEAAYPFLALWFGGIGGLLGAAFAAKMADQAGVL